MGRSVVCLLISSLLLSACAPSAQPPATTPPGAKPTEPAKAAPAAQPPAGTGGSLVFISTQFRPVEEAEKMRQVILKDAPVRAEYIPEDTGPFNDRMAAEQQAGRVTVSLVGGLHGDFAPLVKAGHMEDVSGVMGQLADRGFPPSFVEFSKLGTGQSYYVPWVQATYVLAINKKAMQYVPQGADVNALTYAQLKEWGQNIQKATNQRRLGFPASAPPQGLLYRFFQGYLYPSYTGSAGVVGFKTPEAVTMWDEFKEIWATANPQSTSYQFMQEPLLSEEVWIAWDHVARLVNAVKERPNDFLIVPAPAGPKGRGFMPVLAGLGIPKGAPNRAGAEQLIQYLTQPQQQAAILRELAFFPATNAPIPEDLPAGVRLEADAVARQAAAPDALPSLLPIGLGAKNNEFNNVYFETFRRIVINNQPAGEVLEEQGRILQGIMDETKASCWPPDPPSDGPCRVR
jgi:multiple sugar transport system substrate-binding protein